MLHKEPGYEALVEVLHSELVLRISAASYVEVCAVMSRAPEKQALVNEFLKVFDVQIIPLDATQARVAAEAYGRYGRGVGIPQTSIWVIVTRMRSRSRWVRRSCVLAMTLCTPT
ncbi:type II toxin-antitoxin system VapC family toxin [Leucobacter insecticola]|uniref:type II toxin-antitoxin system VapC family toxin n=1 Tax=Leucobacter insecticola TaxID=2714934 RepID=UPI003CC7179B